VIGEAADGQGAMLKARELKPDLVLMNARMRGMKGVDAARQRRNAKAQSNVSPERVFYAT